MTEASRQVKSKFDPVLNPAQRGNTQTTQWRIDRGLLFQCGYLIAFGPGLATQAAIARSNRDTQSESPMMNRGDRHHANIQGMTIKDVARNDQRWPIFIETHQVNFAAFGIPA